MNCSIYSGFFELFSIWLTFLVFLILPEHIYNLQVKIVSAHRTPEMMFSYASSAHERDIQIIIAGAGGAAHLPGKLYLNYALYIVSQ